VMTLALLQAYVGNQGDAWAYTSSYLGRFLDEAGAPAPAPEPVEENVHGGYVTMIETLATRTAELHRALAQVTGDSAFDPEPATAEDYARWIAHVREQAVATLDLLASRADSLPEPRLAEARALLAERERLLAAIARCPMPRAATLKTRQHGDYHLGQVLVSRNDFIIIDFEGEPGRTFAERRIKNSPLRDVAGMLRSFSYARAAALQRLPETSATLERQQALAADWEQQTRAAFLTAYDAAARGAGLYASFADVEGLLRLFELEKSLYELRYEIDNRPDWIGVPLRGVAQLVGPAAS
jgi:maltose alpha-D-glucosyltransferase / alpha-amylase